MEKIRGLMMVFACAAVASGCSSKKAGTSVGAAGGAVTSPSGIVLSIPAGALAKDAFITILDTQDAGPAKSGAMTRLIRFEPTGLTFAKPVQVTMNLPPGVSAASFYWSLAKGSGWEPLQTYLADSGTVTTFTRHFSTAFLGTPVGAPGLVWRGAWDVANAYSTNDVVQYNGSSFVAIVDNTGADPSLPSHTSWQLVAGQGATGQQGPKGDPGAGGSIGLQGLPGPQGPTGATGAQGPVGLGLTGSQGAQGPAGRVGPPGITGATGLQGIAGISGAAGTAFVARGTSNPLSLSIPNGATYAAFARAEIEPPAGAYNNNTNSYRIVQLPSCTLANGSSSDTVALRSFGSSVTTGTSVNDRVLSIGSMMLAGSGDITLTCTPGRVSWDTGPDTFFGSFVVSNAQIVSIQVGQVTGP